MVWELNMYYLTIPMQYNVLGFCRFKVPEIVYQHFSLDDE